MKLSPAQRRAVSKLAQFREGATAGWTQAGFYGMRTNTLDSLVKLELVERRTRFGTLDYEYRVTPRGYGYALIFGEEALL